MVVYGNCEVLGYFFRQFMSGVKQRVLAFYVYFWCFREKGPDGALQDGATFARRHQATALNVPPTVQV